MAYWVFKYGAFVWLCHLLFRPSIEGKENIPKSGAGDPGQQPHLGR